MDKQDLRERIWDHLEAEGIARFPFPPHDRIPNFAGGDDAADRLAETDEWEAADAIKANPDAPQLPVRRRALREGKTVYMAVPRLRDEKPFYELDPAAIPPDEYDSAPTISHVESYAQQVAPEEVAAIDLVVSGSVAVTAAGARVGKGEGYSDLEYAVLRELDLVGAETPIATTVHDSQVVADEVTVEAHDVPMDLVVTPTETFRTDTEFERPSGVFRDDLSAERIAEIPVLDERRD
ncbi:5-formyltetrahydrofolate cyclo-ligase [Halorussus gelatinilyticus]|uniref:5-formyltetrahydrofolate cyclo-ligase n=1 Tax=Halorussus gelatinilyticus TaxID=2937524 RepID=A0A8U0IKZ8_9EURY|nr:5-formyltetrahydrofolate cyclo-ligase [Halorussus gelatinilyticus]UPW01810.1 5-formyltetrahydrofolate cyclo-ligase [Halorussus gelatinilyticus]